jgi:23S rRNA (guanine745-N1)-methyltransferase
VARQGYVNLLTVQQKHALAPGDTREQVLSRRAFLEAGYYTPIPKTLIETSKKNGVSGDILDIGCGEGWYSSQLAETLGLPLTGLDISKEAVRCAAAKYKNHQWLCATAAHIPVPDGSAGLITSLFALTLLEEFHRILAEGGLYFQVLAAQDHLLGLKGIIYDELIFRDKDSTPELPGFTRLESIPIRFTFTVEGEQIQNLFSMTPHVFRIGKAGAEALAKTERLADTASCVLNVYRKAE